MHRPAAKFDILVISLFFCATAFAQSRLSFDGYNDYVELNGADFPPPWTFECWVQRTGEQPYSHLMTGADGTSGIRLEQYINTGKVGITKAGVADWQFNYSPPVGTWVHLAVVCSPTTMTLYINGQSKGSITGTINMPMGKIGAQLFGAGALLAKVDEVRIWNTTLTPAVLNQWKNQPVTDQHPNYANLQHYYPLDEGSGPIAHDTKGTLHGAISGASWAPVFGKDLEAAALVKPTRYMTQFSAADSVVVRVANVGSQAIAETFTVAYQVDGNPWVQTTVNVSGNPVAPFGARDVKFPVINLTNSDIHAFRVAVTLPNDGFSQNDTLQTVSSKQQITLGNLAGVTYLGPDSSLHGMLLNLGVTKLLLQEPRPDIFRLVLAPAGVFQDPTDGLIAVNGGKFDGPNWLSSFTDMGDYYLFAGANYQLRAYKTPLLFALYTNDNQTLVWQETAPISFGQSSIQQLGSTADEYFYGCGMQNGYFSHKGKSVRIENDYSNSWGLGAIPNPAPFFMSTKGYGLFRNTFEKGQYDFLTPALTLAHEGEAFDVFIIGGQNLKGVLDGYTWITGRPFLLPRWGLEFGDADCYNDTGTTMDGFTNIAKKYREKNFPGGWMLPNDGYSCGYENLEAVRDSLQNIGFRLGLWTENGTTSAPFEVGQAGVGVYKLDVALVGPGYRSAFQSGLNAWNGIEGNSARRGYVWTVAGWAGTQRFATIWSGDQSGNFNNLKLHIPTIIGAGLSGFNTATGDIDGIFGGSAASYARDLQWKCFTPAMMTISGWASTGKQPWAYGSSWETFNRYALRQKMRLTPYLYSYCREAYDTGVPAVRGMVLEFPDDTICAGTQTQYQFMSGEWFLIAPVLVATPMRDDIYLPAGKWHDWADGSIMTGPQWIDNYLVPFTRVPAFVRAGAIIPMQPYMDYDGQRPFDTLVLHLYPSGETAFRLYEDDGWSQAYRNGASRFTNIHLQGPVQGFDAPVRVCVDAATGDGFPGAVEERAQKMYVHFPNQPQTVRVLVNGDTLPLPAVGSLADWNTAVEGWYFSSEKGGVVYVKTAKYSVHTPVCVEIGDFLPLGLLNPVAQVDASVFPSPTKGNFTVKLTDRNDHLRRLTVVDASGHTVLEHVPAGARETQVKLRLNAAPGVYFVVVETEKGKGVQRVVRE